VSLSASRAASTDNFDELWGYRTFRPRLTKYCRRRVPGIPGGVDAYDRQTTIWVNYIFHIVSLYRSFILSQSTRLQIHRNRLVRPVLASVSRDNRSNMFMRHGVCSYTQCLLPKITFRETHWTCCYAHSSASATSSLPQNDRLITLRSHLSMKRSNC